MMKKRFKLIVSAVAIATIGMSLVGCGGKEDAAENKKIAVSGSTSIGPLMEKFAASYEEKNSDISIEINQVGSSAGIKDTINGVSEIGMSSRELKEDEKSKVDGAVIAYDGIAIITNKNNPIKNLTKAQIKDIYTGKITNWNQIPGGKDAPIVVVSREDGSGTRAAFEELVGYKAEELIKKATISSGNGEVKTTVKGNENAIGFVSFEYLDDSINVLNVDNVAPTADAVKAKTYTLSRPFIVVTTKERLTDNGKNFIEFMKSEEGQKIVKDNKLITIE